MSIGFEPLTPDQLERKARTRQKRRNNKIIAKVPLFADQVMEFGGITVDQAREEVKKNWDDRQSFSERFDKTRAEFNKRCQDHIHLFKIILADLGHDYMDIMGNGWSHSRFTDRDPAYESDHLANLVKKPLGLSNCLEVHQFLGLGL